MCFVCVSAAREAGAHPNHIEEATIYDSGASFGYSASTADYVDELIHGASWSGDEGPGSAATVSYTFSISGFSNQDIIYDDNPIAFNTAQQAAAEAAMAKITAFANITFVEASSASSADMLFYIGDFESYNASGLAGYYYSHTSTDVHQLTNSTVGMDDDYTDFTTEGVFSYTTLLHEIGHAIGLKHPGNYGGGTGPFLPTSLDSTNYTVMSYNDGDDDYWTNPDNYQSLDIAALQYLYGAAGESGVSTEGSSGNDNYTLASAIDYKAGLGSDSIQGSSGNDTIYGGRSRADSDDVGDTLYGNNGDDALFGNAGDDLIYGDGAIEAGSDGSDEIWGGKGEDTIYGGGGADIIGGGGDRYNPTDDGDIIYGGAGNDSFTANGGDDRVYGGSGADWVHGGAGGDTLDGGSGNDTIIGGIGVNYLTGGTGVDTFQFTLTSDGWDNIQDYESGDIIEIDVADPSAVSSITDLITSVAMEASSVWLSLQTDTFYSHTIKVDGVSSLDEMTFNFI